VKGVLRLEVEKLHAVLLDSDDLSEGGSIVNGLTDDGSRKVPYSNGHNGEGHSEFNHDNVIDSLSFDLYHHQKQ
jgi:hypothetical protein